MNTRFARKEDAERKWYVVDAEDKVLGRLASRVAARLRGKHKAIFTPNVDTGDFVIIVNAEKVRLTGRKLEQKTYYRHSGFPGGLRSETAGDLLARRPEQVITEAVRGMLPKNRLGRKMIKKLKVYIGGGHPHSAQAPEKLSLQ